MSVLYILRAAHVRKLIGNKHALHVRIAVRIAVIGVDKLDGA